MSLKELTIIEKNQVEYKGEKFYVERFEIQNGLIRVYTNKRTLIINEEDLDINDFKILDKPSQTENPYLPIPVDPISSTIIGTNAGELTNILMDNIKKIKEDPGYIAQADAINNNVKSIIDVAKAQIDAFKVMKGN